MALKRYSLSARSRLASWFNGTEFDPKKLRGLLMGILFNITIGEVCCYRLIKQDIKAGELPFYTADVMIVIFAIFEAVAAPVVSWWGFRKRRMLLTWYTVAAFVCSISWFLLPEKMERQESELCNAANSANNIGFVGTSPRTAVRLVIVSISCIIFILTRVVCWSHGIAYSDEYAPARTSMHYGVLLLARVLPFFLGHKTLTGMTENNIIFQIVLLLLGFSSNFLQLPRAIPKEAPLVDGVQMTALSLENRGLCKSIGRVLYNPVAMTLIFSTGLTTASVWGYGYYELDIIKVKFNLLPHTTIYEFFAEIGTCPFIVVAVAYAGVVFSAPVLMEFCKLKALKQAVGMSILMFLVYIIMTAMPNCETGNIAGFVNGDYGHPECSLSCNCKPQWDEYKPVCAVDDMITYMSPCHAGCSESQEINGIQ
ncbi:unnamed protein product [Euphydryas editha]|nr:unnamed protein product [Euphydryas editha]